MNEEMITRKLDVSVFPCAHVAPSYGKEVKMLRIEKALIVQKGTVKGNTTVDLQMIDEDGKPFLVMATGGILQMLAAAIKGVSE